MEVVNTNSAKCIKFQGYKNHFLAPILLLIVFNFSVLFVDSHVLGNNVRFNSKPSVVLSSDSIMISFSLSWDHSWRDDFNWDAVWVFGKYSKGTQSAWNHLKLSPTGHIMPQGFTYDAGKIDANNAGGIFLMRDDEAAGNVNSQTFTIKIPRSNLSTVTDRDFERGDVFITFSAIEMVYIPYGGYYLGDGTTFNRFGGSGGTPIAINSEDAVNVYPVTSGTVGGAKNVPAVFPKGYKGFYCMKYEVSQDQYVSFLNNLTRAQQKAHIGNNLDELKVGEYVFGDKSRPSNRNGICVLSNLSGKPAIFGCNLNPAEPYFGEDDGKCIACNYLTPADMLAYCDWACLRPMSELEFEKACRKPYPQEPVAGEFAWNSNFGVNTLNGASSLVSIGKVSEQPMLIATNVNYDNPGFGPVRCASFGTSSSTQAQAGATFWGLMEMSGNVAELCYSVDAGSYFNTSDIYNSHGNGEINTNTSSGVSDVPNNIWHNANTSFIAKGGSFGSTSDDEIAISDRTMSSIAGTRDSTVGFRAVHTFGGNVAVNSGIIKVSTISCAEGINVRDSVQGSVKWNGVAMNTRITYVWYVQKGSAAWELIPDEVSESLTYVPASFTEASQIFRFKRKTITTLGEATTAEVSTTVPNLTISLSSVNATLIACSSTTTTATATVTASVPYKDKVTTPTFTWITQMGTKTGASYTPEGRDFMSGSSGNISVTCQAELSGCSSSANLTVAVSLPSTQPKISFNNCGSDFTDSRNGQVYPTVQIGTQCWMATNMNIGERVDGSDYTTHQTAGIQKVCYNNDENNCDTYGGLYSWAEAVNGENVATGEINTATDFNKKCVLDLKGNDVTQGICPDGWHVPSDAEWQKLERFLGMDSTVANSTDWRGSDQASKLKTTTWGGTNSSGWSGLPGGPYYGFGGTYYDVGSSGNWWSSSENSSSDAWRRLLRSTRGTVYRNPFTKSLGFSVRCLLN
ncbi:MAG: SUMF1/EgtB/PvdO family nonheme iron enzyme [Culturomica sp.]|jgi:uncharacterized protein (TIGR02145 family)|nr:SUMF1/EgtB/PvdO family nonheme iron enzyme [Culturomica sp.]